MARTTRYIRCLSTIVVFLDISDWEAEELLKYRQPARIPTGQKITEPTPRTLWSTRSGWSNLCSSRTIANPAAYGIILSGSCFLALGGEKCMPATDAGCWNHAGRRHSTFHDDLISSSACQSGTDYLLEL
jgi:hypothetical protein